MIGNPVGWFEIYVDDMARAKKFYETVLDVELESLGDESNQNLQMQSFPSTMEIYGAGGALVRMEGFSAGRNSTLVYFSCNNCSLEESRIVAAGGDIQRPKMAIGEYGFITLGIDTEGNMFGLHSQK